MHEKLYSSEVLVLVILSNKSIESMEKIVDGLFDKVLRLPNFVKPEYHGVPANDIKNCGYLYK